MTFTMKGYWKKKEKVLKSKAFAFLLQVNNQIRNTIT